MNTRYEITDDGTSIIIAESNGIRSTIDPVDGQHLDDVVIGAIRQQSADLDKLRAELAAALDLLDTIFAAYEDGVPCYQDPDEIIGYLGNAVLLDDDTFRRAASLLNQSKPRKDGE